MSKDFPVPSLDGEETVVGVHASGITLHEGLNTSNSRNYCANCKRKIHCYVKIDRETKEAIIHKTCKNDDCECKCRTHYACKQCGYLHPYGMDCDRKEEERAFNPEADNLIADINKQFLELYKEKEVEPKA